MGIKDIPTSACSAFLPMGASLGCATPSLRAIRVLHRLEVVKEVGSVWKCPKPPANLSSWGNTGFLVMFFDDASSQAKLVSSSTSSGPPETLRLWLRVGREEGTGGSGHWVGATWPGDAAWAEQGHSCQAHSSLPVADRPWAAPGRRVGGSGCGQHWVITLVQAGAGQH